MRVLAAIAALTLSSGCVNLDFGCIGAGGMDGPCPTYSFHVAPMLGDYSSNILVGDTLWLSIFGDNAHRLGEWTITGAAVTGLDADTSFKTIKGKAGIRIKGVARGNATIRAQSGDLADDIIMNVADSTDIVTIQALAYANDIAVNQSAWIEVQFLDATSRKYFTAGKWTVSDTSLASVVPGTSSMYGLSLGGTVHARKPGTVTVSIAVGSLRKDVLMTIRP